MLVLISAWQIGMVIIVALYALMGLYAVLATARAWGQIDLDSPALEYCPPGTRCRLCGEARVEPGPPGPRR